MTRTKTIIRKNHDLCCGLEEFGANANMRRNNRRFIRQTDRQTEEDRWRACNFFLGLLLRDGAAQELRTKHLLNKHTPAQKRAERENPGSRIRHTPLRATLKTHSIKLNSMTWKINTHQCHLLSLKYTIQRNMGF